MPDVIMPDQPIVVKPFAGDVGQRFRVTAVSARARLALRGDPAALGAIFGMILPTAPCRSVTDGEHAALWLGPDEWLLLVPSHEAARFNTTAAVEGCAVVDVSHRQLGFVLDGSDVEEVLSAACPLDLHISAFPLGMCTRTIFGKAEIVLWRQGSERFHLEVWRSFAAYVLGLVGAAGAAIGKKGLLF